MPILPASGLKSRFKFLPPEPPALLAAPDVPQVAAWDCGAAVVSSVCRFYGVGPTEVVDLHLPLGTTQDEGTPPANIVAYLTSLGLQVEERHGMSLGDLAECWKQGLPVLTPIQDYGSPRGKRGLESGHWVVVIGAGLGHVFIQDPSEDYVLDDHGSEAAPGRVVIEENDFLEAWADKDGDGNLYQNYGIIVGPPRVAADLLRSQVKGWVTMGGKPCGEGQHCGGTPVELSASGEIEKGPQGTVGKKPEDLPRKGAKPKAPTVGKGKLRRAGGGGGSKGKGTPAIASGGKPAGDVLRALQSYKHGGARSINKILRTGKLGEQPDTGKWTDVQKLVPKIDAALEKNHLTSPATVYRGIGINPETMERVVPDDVSVGYEFTDPGYSSTSSVEQNALKFADDTWSVVAEIKLPAGQNIMALDPLVDNQAQENEYLLPRGMAYRVVGVGLVATPKGRRKKVVLEVVGGKDLTPLGGKSTKAHPAVREVTESLLVRTKGYSPTELQRAERVDLVTLPEGVSGTNCGNCRFMGEGGFCTHPEVQLQVTPKMCCAEWDAEGTYRAWIEQQKALSAFSDNIGGALVAPAKQKPGMSLTGKTLSPPQVKALPALVKAGFTGSKRDSRGHTHCYRDGVNVPCSQLSNMQEPGGGQEKSPQGQQSPGEGQAQQHQEEKPSNFAPPPEGEELKNPECQDCIHDPDPHLDLNGDGVADAARVGVPAMEVPPPPQEVPRLPNLTGKEREVEDRFASMYLKDPDGLAKLYREKLSSREVGDAPHIFGTDDCKALSPDWTPKEGGEDAVKYNRGAYNAVLHQTANALAKRAFLQHLDEVVAQLPDEKKVVLVTSGGVAAGKGYALKNIPETANMLDSVGAVWDAAGEQCATENPWISQECEKRGIKMVFAYVHADPIQTWENPQRGVVERAGKIGRMVDARAFADSYAMGSRNFQAFMDAHLEDADKEFFVLNNATGGKPARAYEMPQEALSVKSEELYSRAYNTLEERKDSLKPGVVRGGTIGGRLWGKPQEVTSAT